MESSFGFYICVYVRVPVMMMMMMMDIYSYVYVIVYVYRTFSSVALTFPLLFVDNMSIPTHYISIFVRNLGSLCKLLFFFGFDNEM